MATPRTAPSPSEPPSPAVLSSLARLIGADEAGRLLDVAFGRDAYRARLSADIAGELFSWAQLNAALAGQRLTPPRLRLELAGRDVTRGVFTTRRTQRGLLLQDLDAAALNARLRDGATLIVDSVNEIGPELRALCAGLSGAFAASCQANLYACWGTTQGFDVHWDDHEVFVVQVEGRKQWALYGPTEAWPTRRGAGKPAPPPQTPAELIVLEPGDVLYLPRGYWHAAVGLGGPTLHLTLGLTRKTGADFVHWLADDLLEDEIARADLPFEAGDAALGARIAQVLAAAAARDPADLARRYRRRVEAGLAQRPELAFPYIGEDEVEIGADARLSLAAGPARLAASAAGPVLSWRGVEFTLAPELEPAVRRLLAGEAVRAAEVAPTAEPAHVQAFLRDMARRGVFVVGAGR